MKREPLEHPGIMLKGIFLEKYQMNTQAAALMLKIREPILELFFQGLLPISLEFANKIGPALNTRPEMWLDVQAQYYQSLLD